MLDLARAPVILKASREPAHDPGPPLHFPQQHRAAIGGDSAAIKEPNQLASSQILERAQRWVGVLEFSGFPQRSDHKSHTLIEADSNILCNRCFRHLRPLARPSAAKHGVSLVIT